MSRPRRTLPPIDRPDGTRALDWSDPSHYSGTSGPCRYCGNGTILRDSTGQYSHKVCAEDWIDRHSNTTEDQ